ncbi:hypothetical protein BC830DRAFT_1133783, partial [Chytriomyces sp. MP71]
MSSEGYVVDWDRTVQSQTGVAPPPANAKSESAAVASSTGHLLAASHLSRARVSQPPAFRGAGNVSLVDDYEGGVACPPEARHTLEPGQGRYEPFQTFQSQYLNSDVPVPYPASATDSDSQQSFDSSTTCKQHTVPIKTVPSIPSTRSSLSPTLCKASSRHHKRPHPNPYLQPSLAVAPLSGTSIQRPHGSSQYQYPGYFSSDAGSKNVCSFPECGLEFKTPWHMLSHRNCHTNVRQFQCMLCPLSFARKHDLTRHERSVHAVREGTPAFSCSLCGKGFGRVDSLKRHIRV